MNDRMQKHYSSVLILLGIIGGLTLVSDGGFVPIADAQDDVLVYVPVSSPCRVLRTQGTGQTHLNAGAPREFFSFGPAGTISAQGGNAAGCDHPRSAVGVLPTAIAANVTAVGNQASGNGNIVAYPAGGAVPGASTVNYTTTANIANSTLITLRASDGKFTLLSSFSNVPALVDVLGYYYPIQSAGGTQNVTVDCAASDTVQDAHDNAAPGGGYVVTVVGTCTEDVTIIRDDMTLKDGTVKGQITVDGARRFRLQSMTVEDSTGHGVHVINQASAHIDQCTIQNNQLAGIDVRSAFAEVTNNTLQGNGITSNPTGPSSDAGLQIRDGGSMVRAIDNFIIDNHGEGLGLYNGASVRVEGNQISRNGTAPILNSDGTVSNFGYCGIGVYNGSWGRSGGGNLVEDNAYGALCIYGGAGGWRHGQFQPIRNSDGSKSPAPGEVADEYSSRPLVSGERPGIDAVTIEVGRDAVLDMRNIHVTGSVFIYQDSHYRQRYFGSFNGIFCNQGWNTGSLAPSVNFNSFGGSGPGGSFDANMDQDCTQSPVP